MAGSNRSRAYYVSYRYLPSGIAQPVPLPWAVKCKPRLLGGVRTFVHALYNITSRDLIYMENFYNEKIISKIMVLYKC